MKTRDTAVRIDSIQVLRGFAALSVAAFHLDAAALTRGFESPFFSLFREGEAGVDIFFVISGFIIYYIASGRPSLTVRQFLSDRFWRIAPPYWLILLAYVAMGAIFSLLTTGAVLWPSLWQAIVSIFLLPQPEHIIIIAWTLSLEVLFYILFALTFIAGGKRTFFAAMIIWVIAAQVLKATEVLPANLIGIAFNTVVLEFLFGAVIAHLTLAGESRFQFPALLLGLISMGAHYAGMFEVGREWSAGIPAALIVYGVLAWRRSIPQVLVLVGEASYILYLVHLLAFSVIGNLAMLAAGVDIYQSTILMLIVLCVVTALSCAATLLLERPYLAWRRRQRKFS